MIYRSGTVREIQEVEIGFAIIYCSTKYMCNPLASLGSLNLDSVDTATPSINTYQDDDTKQDISHANRDEASHIYSDTNFETANEDKKDTRNLSRPSCSVLADAEARHTSSSSVNAVHISPKTSTTETNLASTSTSNLPFQTNHASTEKPTSTANPTSTENPTTTENPTSTENLTSAENPTTTENLTTTENPTTIENPTTTDPPSPTNSMSPIGSLSPVGVLSPIEAMSPMHEVDEDMPLPSLNNLFDDFVGTLKARPPPRKQAAEASSSNNSSIEQNSNSDSVPKTSDHILPHTATIQKASDRDYTVNLNTEDASTNVRNSDDVTNPAVDCNTGTTANTRSTTVRSSTTEVSAENDHDSTTSRSPIIDHSSAVDRDTSPDAHDSVLVVDQPPSPDRFKKPTVNNNNIDPSPSNIRTLPDRSLRNSSVSNSSKEITSDSGRKTRARPEPSFVSQMNRSRKRKNAMDDFMRYDNDETDDYNEQEISAKIQYSNIIYAPLVVEPPPSPPQGTSGGVNYKIFRKASEVIYTFK